MKVLGLVAGNVTSGFADPPAASTTTAATAGAGLGPRFGLVLRDAGGRLFNVVESMKGVGDVAGSPLAMNTHMEREGTEHLQRSMDILAQCGVKWIRAWWGWWRGTGKTIPARSARMG